MRVTQPEWVKRMSVAIMISLFVVQVLNTAADAVHFFIVLCLDISPLLSASMNVMHRRICHSIIVLFYITNQSVKSRVFSFLLLDFCNFLHSSLLFFIC